jgi:hypothetical protein
MKKCSKCGEIKSKEENFSKDKKTKDGYNYVCKLCNKKYRKENKDKINKYNKKYKLKNKDKLKQQNRQYYYDNKNKMDQQSKQYKLENKDKIKQYNQQYNSNNKDKIKQYNQQFADYDQYANQLINSIEKPKRANNNLLKVKCRYCGKYFIPTIQSVKHRVESLNSNKKGERSLYCSDECKNACPVYNTKFYQKDQKNKISYTTEVVPLLRQIVLKRDNYTCQECKATNVELHCHHLIPKSYDKIIQNDPTNCITLCKNCHIKKHQKPGCKNGELRKNSINSCL